MLLCLLQELGLTTYLLQGGEPKHLRVEANVQARIAKDVWRQLRGGGGAPMTTEEEGLLQVMLDAFGPYDHSSMLVDVSDFVVGLCATCTHCSNSTCVPAPAISMQAWIALQGQQPWAVLSSLCSTRAHGINE